MKFLAAILCLSVAACAGAPKKEEPVEKTTKRHDGKILGTLGGAGAGAAMGYSSAGMMCAISGPLCLIVVVPAALVGGVVGLAAGSVVDSVNGQPKQQGAAPPADTSAPQGG
jgi:hypothetical protein